MQNKVSSSRGFSARTAGTVVRVKRAPVLGATDCVNDVLEEEKRLLRESRSCASNR